MNFSKDQLMKISYWKVLAISLGVQAAANLLFGLPLMIIVFMDYPPAEVKEIAFLYLALYAFLYIPLYALLPFILLPRINRFLQKYHRKKEIKLKEVTQTTRKVLNFPLNIAFWVFITCFSGFLLGLIIAKWGGFLEIVIGKTEIIITLSIGFIVGLTQSWLNYILFERFLQPLTQLLVQLYPQLSPTDLNCFFHFFSSGSEF